MDTLLSPSLNQIPIFTTWGGSGLHKNKNLNLKNFNNKLFLKKLIKIKVIKIKY